MSTPSENTGSLSSLADPNAASTVDTETIDVANPAPVVQPTTTAAPPPVPAKAEVKMQMVRLSSERASEALPEGRVNIGRVTMEIPAPESQTAGFELTKEQAAVLVPQFSQYKFVTEKGTTTPPVTI